MQIQSHALTFKVEAVIHGGHQRSAQHHPGAECVAELVQKLEGGSAVAAAHQQIQIAVAPLVQASVEAGRQLGALQQHHLNAGGLEAGQEPAQFSQDGRGALLLLVFAPLDRFPKLCR